MEQRGGWYIRVSCSRTERFCSLLRQILKSHRHWTLADSYVSSCAQRVAPCVAHEGDGKVANL